MLSWFETVKWISMRISDLFNGPYFSKSFLIAIILSVVSGIFYSLGFPSSLLPTSIFFTHLGVLLFFFVISINCKIHSLSKILFLTLAFSIAHNFMGFYWISYTVENFGGIYFPWNYILSTLFSLIIIPYYFVITIIIYHRQLISQKIKLIENSFPLFLSIVSVLLENYFPQQFPAHLGHTWMHISPFLGLAPIGGVPLFSFISYFLIFSLIDFYFEKDKKIIILPISAFALFLLLNLLFPLSSKKWKEQNSKNINVRMVQGNIGNFLKISAEGGLHSSITEVLNDFYDLSLKDLPKDNDLIIWPETAYPRLINSNQLKSNSKTIPDLMKRILRNSKSSLLFGGYDFAESEEDSLPKGFKTEYNSAFYLNYDLSQNVSNFQNVYHKIRLIPFGEGLPLGPFNSFFARYIENISFFAEGAGPVIFKTNNGANFFTIICYETLFSSFIRDFVMKYPEADFIVNITNDSWYGRTSEPFQHLFLAKWRSLEFQLPMFRMTNTGATSLIYPDGSESIRTSLFQKTYQDHSLSLPKKDKNSNGFTITIFAQFGHLVWLSIVLFLGLINYFLRAKPSRIKS